MVGNSEGYHKARVRCRREVAKSLDLGLCIIIIIILKRCIAEVLGTACPKDGFSKDRNSVLVLYHLHDIVLMGLTGFLGTCASGCVTYPLTPT